MGPLVEDGNRRENPSLEMKLHDCPTTALPSPGGRG